MSLEKERVDAAGDLLKSVIPRDSFRAPEVVEAFTIANGWRERHLDAIRQIRAQLAAANRTLQTGGVTAARLKRMPAIRRKLRRLSYKLSELQDLGGCRVILPTIDDVKRFSDRLQQSDRHQLRETDDYILRPKKDGYRSLHLLLNHDDLRFPGQRGLRIELQVRTHLQHAWATAVEALGLYLRVNIKGGEGSEAWRRLLMLMSCEFAESEGCAPVRGAPSGGERRSLIIELDRQIGARAKLDNLAHGFQIIDRFVFDRYAKHLLLRYDHAAKRVDVEAFTEAPASTRVYGDIERRLAVDSIDDEDPSSDTVLVSLGQLKDLKKAFPNYFGDVRVFREQLGYICQGRGVATYNLPKQALAPPRPREMVDPAWLRRPRFDKPSGA